MDRNNLVLGGIALVLGVLLGLLFAPRGASLNDIEMAMDERLAAVETAASGTPPRWRREQNVSPHADGGIAGVPAH